MTGGGVNGLALGSVAAGGLFLYAAVQGKSILSTVQALIKGQSPSSASSANKIPLASDIANAAASAAGSVSAGGSTAAGVANASGLGTGVASTSNAQQALQQTAAQFGWGSGAQWQALFNLEMQEAGFNPNARNPSGAYGLAQSLGHPEFGYAEYGGYGLTRAQVAAANNGDAAAQALWMCRYIASTYGDPIHAWEHEKSHNWY